MREEVGLLVLELGTKNKNPSERFGGVLACFGIISIIPRCKKRLS